MARLIPVSRRCGLLAALAGWGALLCLSPGRAAAASAAPILAGGENVRTNLNAGTTQWDDFVLHQAPDTVITATRAEGSNLPGGSNDNGHWSLTGKVHIEYQGSVLDADTATVVFAGGQLQSIEVHGRPALFSHPTRTAGVVCRGRADTIDFDGTKRQVSFTGHVEYSYGVNEGTSDKPMIYELDSSVLRSVGEDAGRVRVTISPARPEKTIPTPRTPDRSTAQ
ncbi:MAG TPA: LptA/OstA family protein [Steroidobacteraceae bacterium]|nr:LptA/OstA family protein [Steroidobacteraceae bacterium]